MMQIDSTSALGLLKGPETSPVNPVNNESSKKVGKDAFLRLLIAQLEHQDPISPTENTEFTAQLAQFNTLEQIETMNSNLTSLLQAQETMNGFQAFNFIGKQIQAHGNSIQVHSGQASTLRYTLAGNSTATTLDIYNQDNGLVQRLEAHNEGPGDHVITWDGRNAQGERVPEGTYTFTVSAVNRAGGQINTDTLIQGKVEGIEFVNNRPQLLIDGRQIELSSVISLTENDTAQ